MSTLPTPQQVETYKNEQRFFNSWRPAIAWSYLVVCVFDFVIIPLVLAAITNDSQYITQWNPNTLKGAGLYHMSMLAIVGVTAWNRTQEKLQLLVDDKQQKKES